MPIFPNRSINLTNDLNPSLSSNPELLDQADEYYENGLNNMNTEDFKRALENFLAAAEIYKKFFKEEQIAYCYDKIGHCYLKRRMWVESYEYLMRAYSKRCEMYPDGRHPELVISLNSIASYFDSLGKHGEANLYKEKAAGVRQAIGDVKDPEFATSLNNMGVSYLKLNDIQLGLDYINQVSFRRWVI